MSNKLCLIERGHFTEPEMCSLWPKNSISYNFCRFSVVIASVGFNIDRVTTQHTPNCAETCPDNKVSIIVLLTPTRFSVSSVITMKTGFFFSTIDKLLVLKGCIHVRFDKQYKNLANLMPLKIS